MCRRAAGSSKLKTPPAAHLRDDGRDPRRGAAVPEPSPGRSSGLASRCSIRLVDSAQRWARMKTFDFDMMQWTWSASLSPGNEQMNRWSVGQRRHRAVAQLCRRQGSGRQHPDRGAAERPRAAAIRLGGARTRPAAAVGRLCHSALSSAHAVGCVLVGPGASRPAAVGRARTRHLVAGRPALMRQSLRHGPSHPGHADATHAGFGRWHCSCNHSAIRNSPDAVPGRDGDSAGAATHRAGKSRISNLLCRGTRDCDWRLPARSSSPNLGKSAAVRDDDVLREPRFSARTGSHCRHGSSPSLARGPRARR